MDQGPVDAGPYQDNEYDLPSPVRRNGKHRDAGTRLHDHTDYLPLHGEADSLKNLGSDSDTLDSQIDPPLFQRVGATADELAEESAYEASDHLTGNLSTLPARATDTFIRLHRMHKFTLYETNARYWITGGDITDKHFKLLRIDRTSPPEQLNVFEDEVVYDRVQLNEVLKTIDDGNRATGGLRIKASFWGLVGFIRFTEAFYMIIITKRQQVAMLGGHYVYQVDGTELIPLTTGSSSRFTRDRNPEEVRFLGILNNLDLTKSFYFSYTYDITRTLQHNIIAQRTALNEHGGPAYHDFNGMFVWNHHLLKPARNALKHPYDWCLPIIHGFIDQASLDVFGRSIYITIVGRRSRFFAGARFLKRGINDQGYVANDVETEQIVSEMLTTSFHAPGPHLFTNPSWTSYVHHRGSIPLYWTQDNSGVNPKPDIELNLPDPFYSPAALHFDNLFERYGCPIYVLNLIKSRERTPRESKLLYAYQDCVEYLNQSLPEGKKIIHKAFDMSRASKTRGGDVIGNLEVIAKDIVEQTGFFHNGDVRTGEPHAQNGIARTNCIDCLDRTNAAQFVIGKRAFGIQLQALGVLNAEFVDYDTDAINIFTHMFHDHGDTIAVQYGGSHLVNTMATYRKLNQWQSHSRDMVESFKRYYHNSFLDSQRQEAYNLFLGNYIWAQGQPMLWDLVTDYYLHHSDPKNWLHRPRRDYIQWYTPEYLEDRVLPEVNEEADEDALHDGLSMNDYWHEYYRPAALSSFLKVYSYRMNSTTRLLPDRTHNKDTNKKYDFSPFKPRLDPHKASHETAEKKPVRKGVKILDPLEDIPESPRHSLDGNGNPSTFATDVLPSILSSATKAATHTPTLRTDKKLDKAQMHLWTLNDIYAQSLDPSISDAEASEYARYVDHPLNLPLVTSAESATYTTLDLVEYCQRGTGGSADILAADSKSREKGWFAEVSEKDLDQFLDFLEPREDVLTVMDEDGSTKRYKAYKQWLRGKSLFKQSKVDPEFKSGL
ncbi:hypothetical protein AMS68_005251 [Peltaster fructicola]|uniref:SAC domain-containing protein n=1 Tax=Peltaster fructicola TaxID=286661 RepID=A0A6H0XYB6_9PEZI|nr:hypothetical protein AMS68_005251 [Peltaster fructicola]